ncbi:hypothetical protein LSAT2_010338 [Lamellibrachia satsuma]|nr:hypothetical protein LSAT2_010338 [Lamellibrachia satsuma]
MELVLGEHGGRLGRWMSMEARTTSQRRKHDALQPDRPESILNVIKHHRFEQCHPGLVVWAESREVGCAYSRCDPMTGTNISPGTYLVCNYGPAGNYPRHPYTKGEPCTACGSGKGWCDNGLCRRECKAECANCGVADQSDCSCTCPKGWIGDYCTRECGNYDDRCGANPGWPTFWCDNEHAYVPQKCPLLCGLCEKADPGATCDATTTTPATTTTTKSTTTTTTPATTTTTKSTTTTTTPATTTTTKPTTTTTTPATTTTTKPTTTTTTPATTTTTKPTTTTTTPATTTTTKPTTTTTTPATTTTTKPTTTTTTPATTTTTKPTTTTTTPTTTTTTKPTTTTTTPTTTVVPSDPCAGVTCKNGGTARVQNGECKCQCSAEWQGKHCQESRAEAKIGVILRIRAPITIWDLLWRYIEPIIVQAINHYCNSHVSTCCPGAKITHSATYQEYLTAAELRVGVGYPQSLVSRGYSYTLALIYAGGAPNNALCASVGGGRSRRSIDIGSSLPQDVILSAVNSVQSNLTAEMSDCCNATLDAVSAAVVADASDWGMTVAGDVTVVAMLAAAAIAAMFWRER